MKRKMICLCGMLLLCGMFWGCNNHEKEESGSGYQIYYTNIEATKETATAYDPKAKTAEDLVNELLMQLATPPTATDQKVAKPENVSIERAELDEHRLNLQFSEKYLDMDRITEVLCRAAYVRTLTQIPDVDEVEFFVGEEPLTDAKGSRVGAMTADSFIDNVDKELGAYEVGSVTLYFADKSGSRLVPVGAEAVLGTSVSTERIVVEKLFKGPDSTRRGVYATIPDGTQLLSISTDNGVCYVNLSADFLKPLPDVTEMVSLYSIVNSLCQLPNVDKVQFAIDGDTEKTFIEDITFSLPFEYNGELIGADGARQEKAK